MREFDRRSKPRYARPKKKRLVFGLKNVIDLLQSGKAVEKIFLQRSNTGQSPPLLRHLASDAGVPIVTVPVEKLRGFLSSPDDRHGGVVALLSVIEFQQLDDLIPFIFESGEDPLFVVLDGVTDVRNAGAIARTAWAAGAHALILGSRGSAALNEKAVVASAGALNLLPVCREKTVKSAIDKLKQHGIVIFGTRAGKDDNPSDLDLKCPMALVMGSEDQGVSEESQADIHHWISLPMLRPFDSYNVSVAAGMIFYEIMKQRGVAPQP